MNRPQLHNPYIRPFLDEEDDSGSYLPPVGPPPVAPPAPPIAVKPKTGLEQMAELNDKRPMSNAPENKPRPLERILGGLAAGAIGFGEGYMNSGPRGRVMPSGMGAQIGGAITNRRYNRAKSEWDDQMAKAEGAAKIEGATAKDNRDTEYHEARTASEKAQQAAAEARTNALNTPKPLEPPKETEAGAFERRKNEAKELGLEPGTAVYQHYVGTGKFPYEPKSAPKESLADINKQRETEAERLGLKGDDRLAYITNGRTPPKRNTPAAKPRSMTPAQEASKAAKDRANALIREHGSVDAAIAAAGTEPVDVQNALNNAKATANRASGKGGGDRASRARELLLGGAAPSAPKPKGETLPAAAKAQLKEDVETAFRNGQVWTLKNGQAVKVR
jgi:hypothetical protein